MKKKAKTTKLINKYFEAVARGEMRKAKKIFYLLLNKGKDNGDNYQCNTKTTN
tara:strand:- start:92 stop:250 length:159 start_codon:yes stop_codon:yes gene_type:complete